MMTKDEYDQHILTIDSDADILKEKLVVNYALDNNSIEIGDIIEDHIGKIKVTRMQVRNSGYAAYPTIAYTGDNLTKKSTINKRNPQRVIHQNNILNK